MILSSEISVVSSYVVCIYLLPHVVMRDFCPIGTIAISIVIGTAVLLSTEPTVLLSVCLIR